VGFWRCCCCGCRYSVLGTFTMGVCKCGSLQRCYAHRRLHARVDAVPNSQATCLSCAAPGLRSWTLPPICGRCTMRWRCCSPWRALPEHSRRQRSSSSGSSSTCPQPTTATRQLCHRCKAAASRAPYRQHSQAERSCRSGLSSREALTRRGHAPHRCCYPSPPRAICQGGSSAAPAPSSKRRSCRQRESRSRSRCGSRSPGCSAGVDILGAAVVFQAASAANHPSLSCVGTRLGAGNQGPPPAAT
jgi:hypothetical protein